MKCCVLFASPRKSGNTHALLDLFLQEWRDAGHEAQVFDLYEMCICPCVACRGCQRDWEHPSCVIQDDLQTVFPAILDADLILLASPVYSWYVTAPMKAALDRLVYAMNKYYGEAWGPSLWQGKAIALLTTCGYPTEKGTDLLAEGISRYARHSALRYLGMYAARHRSYKDVFMTPRIEEQCRQFARDLLQNVRQ